MPTTDFSRLKRPLQPLPSFVRKALGEHGLMAAYRARPAYQQNDYLSWIQRAKRADTRQKRLEVMLMDLQAGDRYMGLPYKPTGRKRQSPYLPRGS